MAAPVNQPQGSQAALGLVNVGTPDPVEAQKTSAFKESAQSGGPTQDLENIGAGLQAHLAAQVATAGVGLHISASA